MNISLEQSVRSQPIKQLSSWRCLLAKETKKGEAVARWDVDWPAPYLQSVHGFVAETQIIKLEKMSSYMNFAFPAGYESDSSGDEGDMGRWEKKKSAGAKVTELPANISFLLRTGSEAC